MTHENKRLVGTTLEELFEKLRVDVGASMEARQRQLKRMKRQSLFPGLYDKDGKRLRAKLFKGPHGMVWGFARKDGTFTGQFLGNTKRALAKRECEVKLEMAPVRAVIYDSGKNFKTKANHITTQIVRADDGYPKTAILPRWANAKKETADARV